MLAKRGELAPAAAERRHEEEPAASRAPIETQSCCRPATTPAACRASGFLVTCTGSPPATDCTQMSKFPARSEAYARNRPSGDNVAIGLQAAAEREAGQAALHCGRWRRRPPSATAPARPPQRLRPTPPGRSRPQPPRLWRASPVSDVLRARFAADAVAASQATAERR